MPSQLYLTEALGVAKQLGAAVVNVADSDASTTQGRYMDTFIIEKYPPRKERLY